MTPIPVKFSKPILELSSDETRILLKKAQNGCQLSRDQLVEGNLKLVLNVVHRFKTNEFEDYFQIGTIGLIKAIDNFDLTRDVRFSTYAVPMILGEIRRHIRDTGGMKVSRSIKDNAKKIWLFRDTFLLQNDREPTLSEMEEMIPMDREDIIMAIKSNEEILSFSSPLGNDDSESVLEERISDPINPFHICIEREVLRQAFKKLNDKEQIVINMRFFEDKTQMEIGKELGVSQAQISRIEQSALKKLKQVV